jgi:UV DNA damage endonuclease
LLGQAWLRANPAPAAHLSLGLLWLRAVIHYLAARCIYVYRLPDRLAACLLADDSPQLRRELGECGGLLEEIRALIASYGIRLSMHLAPELAPGSTASSHMRRSNAAILTRLQILDALGAPGSVLVTHLAGPSDDTGAARRYARQINKLAGAAQAHIAIENGEHGGGLAAALALHGMAGTPVVFDTLHHQINNPDRLGLSAALRLALATWPAGVRPKIHIASQRTEAHLLGPNRGGGAMHIIPPRIGQHADFVHPFECIACLEAAQSLRPFDALLEAKAGDLALLRLRDDLARFAPHLCGQVEGC